jgi:hypothetical protein
MQAWKTSGVDNRNALASVQVHNFFDYNGKHQVSRQTRSTDSETIATQSQRCDASANDAEDSAIRANALSGASSCANLSYR